MRSLTSTGKYISNRIGKAIADYSLIEDKDRILVGVSGGKDSLALIELLNERKKWAPVDYELIAFHVESDHLCSNAKLKGALKAYFKKKKIESYFKKVKLIDKKDPRGVSCFWCSWNRRKALFLAAEELKCNKVALGHHTDDIIETMLLNLFYQGQFAAMNPAQELFKGKLVIIRPLCYVEEAALKRFAKESGFPTHLHSCPSSEISKRKMMKDFIKKVERHCPHVKKNLFRSISRVKEEYIQIKQGGPSARPAV